MFSPDQILRFWHKVRKSRGCWLWTACKSSSGYGYVKIGGRGHGAHRVSYAIQHGSMPKGICRHKCDNRRCVRPSHLLDGTQKDNVADMSRRGRRSSVNQEKNRKLSDHDLLRIHRDKKAGRTTREIAAKLSVSQALVVYVLQGRKAYGRRLKALGG